MSKSLCEHIALLFILFKYIRMELLDHISDIVLFCFLTKVWLTYNILLVSEAHQNGWIFLYITECSHGKSSYLLSLYSYYNIVDYVLYAIHYISMAYLLCNWNFVPLNPYFAQAPTARFSGNQQVCCCCCCCFSCIYEYVSVLFVHLFWFSDSTHKWNHTIFVYLCLIFFT